MRNLLVTLVLLAAFVPQVVRAKDDQTIQKIGAGLQIIGFIAGLTNHSQQSSPVYQPVTPNLNTAVNPLEARRVVIDNDRSLLRGNAGSRVRDIIKNQLGCFMSRSGKVIVVMDRKDTKFAADLHDYVQYSGRYNPRSVAQVPQGEWLAPTDIVKLSGMADLSYEAQQVHVSGRIIGGGLNARYRRAFATVNLVLETIDLRTGRYMPGIQAYGQAEKLIDLQVSTSGSAGSMGRREAENALLYTAVYQALDGLVAQLDPTPIVVPAATTVSGENTVPQLVQPVVPQAQPKPTVVVSGDVTFAFPSGRAFAVSLNADKVIHEGDLVKFSRAGKVEALSQYKVKALAGQTVLLELEYGTQPELKDEFKIICTH